jgi:hypothetical protein
LTRAFLLELVPKGAVSAEIGVWKGDFSAQMLEIVKPRKLHLIDPWLLHNSDEYARAKYGRPMSKSQERMDEVHQSVLDRFAAPIEAGVVEVHRASSEDAAAAFEDGYFDWVYVDGNHTYDFVKRDLKLYFEKIKSGGLLGGDDYRSAGWWKDGVTRAVDDFVRSGRCELVLTKAEQFLLRKP